MWENKKTATWAAASSYPVVPLIWPARKRPWVLFTCRAGLNWVGHTKSYCTPYPGRAKTRNFQQYLMTQVRVTKGDWDAVPGVWISALCRGGISLIRLSCISGGMVIDRPWGYKRSDVSPSGSSHTWCCRPGKRSTFDSMEGQYLQKTRNCLVCNV